MSERHPPVGPDISPDGMKMEWACWLCGHRLTVHPQGRYCGVKGCRSKAWYKVTPPTPTPTTDGTPPDGR